MSLAVNWPGYVHVFLQLENSVGNANSFSYADVECSFKDQLVYGSWFYTYCLTLLIVPILMMVALVSLYVLSVAVCKQKKRKTGSCCGGNGHTLNIVHGGADDGNNTHGTNKNRLNKQLSLRSRLINICVIVMYLMWSWCSLTILQVIFDCNDKGDGVKRLAFDLEQICYVGHHRIFLYLAAIPGFICYIIGAPILVALILWRIRNQLGDPEVLARYGFLLAGYRRERYYWEIVIMARRFCVVFVAVALDNIIHLQLAVSSLTCLMFLIIHVTYKPYATDEATLLSRLNAAFSQTMGDRDRHIQDISNQVEMIHLSNNKNGNSNFDDDGGNSNQHHRRDHSHGLLREVGSAIIQDQLSSSTGQSLSSHTRSSSTSSSTSSSSSSFSSSSSKTRGALVHLRRSSLPKITARTIAAYGEKVYKVEMYALVTNYFTFYLALFLAGDHNFVRSTAWSNVVGGALIIGNVVFVVYYIHEYKTTFVNKVTREKRNLKMIANALKGRAVNGWKYLKKNKPPVDSTMSIRIDANMITTINALRVSIDKEKYNRNSKHETESGGGSSNKSSSSKEDRSMGDGVASMNELGLTIGERILPEGYEEYCDSTSGFFFWVNTNTGESTWEPPDGMIGADPNPSVVESQNQLETETSHQNPLHY